MKKKLIIKKIAFTLAEVMVTLSILGIVAAITIPSIHRNFQDRLTVTRFMKNYAVLDSALQQLAIEEANNDLSNLSVGLTTSDQYSKLLMERLSNYIRITNMRDSNENNNKNKRYKFRDELCTIKYLNGKDTHNGPCNNAIYIGDIPSTGATIVIEPSSKYWQNRKCWHTANEYESCGNIYIDIDGFGKGPNRWGYDKFVFEMHSHGLHDSNTTMRKTMTTSRCALSKNQNADMCSIWILKYKNLLYKYRDIPQLCPNVNRINQCQWDGR